MPRQNAVRQLAVLLFCHLNRIGQLQCIFTSGKSAFHDSTKQYGVSTFYVSAFCVFCMRFCEQAVDLVFFFFDLFFGDKLIQTFVLDDGKNCRAQCRHEIRSVARCGSPKQIVAHILYKIRNSRAPPCNRTFPQGTIQKFGNKCQTGMQLFFRSFFYGGLRFTATLYPKFRVRIIVCFFRNFPDFMFNCGGQCRALLTATQQCSIQLSVCVGAGRIRVN